MDRLHIQHMLQLVQCQQLNSLKKIEHVYFSRLDRQKTENSRSVCLSVCLSVSLCELWVVRKFFYRSFIER